MTGALNIVLPARAPGAAKNRLSPLLSDEARSALSVALFRQALAFYRENWPEAQLTVVTDFEGFRAEAEAAGAVVLDDPGAGLNAAVDAATVFSRQHGFERQMIVHADIAILDQAEVAQLVEGEFPPPAIVIVPATGDGGTNVLLESPPGVIAHHYGAGSCALHREAAAEKGVPVTELTMPGLGLDLDTADDIRAYLATRPAGPIADLLVDWDVA